jgi:hypothetical protein
MKARTILLIPALVVAALVRFDGTAFSQSELLTFDDLSGFEAPIPNGYGGLQWDQFSSYNTVVLGALYGPTGENNGVVSSPNVAFNQGGVPASISGGPFNLISGYLMGVWNDGLQVEVQGFVGATLTYDKTYSVGTQGSTLINFGYLGVDKVEFISSGGVPHGFPQGSGFQFAMDDLDITGSIPEPSPLAMAGLGLAVKLLLRRRTCEKHAAGLNESRQPTPVERSPFCFASAARRGCVLRSVP